MGSALSDLTVGELLVGMAGLLAVYKFAETIISPIVKKWLKIDKTAIDLTALQALEPRVEALEVKADKDFARLNTHDEVNVLLMKAMRALLTNLRTGNNVANLKSVEDEINGYLLGRVNS